MRAPGRTFHTSQGLKHWTPRASFVGSGIDDSGKGMVRGHAAPNGAWLYAWNVAINMALLTELSWLFKTVECAGQGRTMAVLARR